MHHHTFQDRALIMRLMSLCSHELNGRHVGFVDVGNLYVSWIRPSGMFRFSVAYYTFQCFPPDDKVDTPDLGECKRNQSFLCPLLCPYVSREITTMCEIPSSSASLFVHFPVFSRKSAQ